MAEERVDVPKISEVTMSCVVGLRRHSAGKSSSGNNEEKVVPHYLRASTGSCHDLCKYEWKFEPEAQKRSCIPKRAERKSLHQISEESLGGITTTSVTKHRASIHSQPKKMSMVKCRKSVDSELQISDASEVSEVAVNKNKTSLVRVKPSLLLPKSNVSSTSKTMRQEISSSFKVDTTTTTTSKPTSKRVGASSISTFKKEEPLLKSTSERVKTHPKSTSQVVKTSSKSTSENMRTSWKIFSFKDREMNLSEKHVTPLRASLSSKTSSKSTSKNTRTSLKISSFKDREMNLSKKHVTPLRASLSSKTSSKSTSKNTRTSLKISSFKDREMNLSEKHATPLRASLSSKTSSKSTSKNTRTSLKISSFKDRGMNLSEKHATPLRASLSSKSSGKRLAGMNMHKIPKTTSHVMNQSKPKKVEPEEHNNEVPEKTLYVIKIESENKTLQSDQNASQDIELSPSHSLSSPKSSSSSVSQFSLQEDQEKSEYATSEFEGDSSSKENHGKEYMENSETFEVEEENGKPQKDDGVVSFEDKEGLKLSGKFVETRVEKISQKRLKFRRGKVLELSATDDKADADNNTDPEKVVLRHQDVEGKKNGKVLLNNVIEETASKLVETKKSKVKALVDAFETIISLQEKESYAAKIVN